MTAQPTHGRGAPHGARGCGEGLPEGKEAALVIKQQHERETSFQSSRIPALTEEDGTLRASQRKRGRHRDRDRDKDGGGSRRRAEAARAPLGRAAALRGRGRRALASAVTYSCSHHLLVPPGTARAEHSPAGTSHEPAAAGKAAGLPLTGLGRACAGKGRAGEAAAAEGQRRPGQGIAFASGLNREQGPGLNREQGGSLARFSKALINPIFPRSAIPYAAAKCRSQKHWSGARSHMETTGYTV